MTDSRKLSSEWKMPILTEITVTSEMVQAAIDAYHDCESYNTDAVNMRAAIEAALAKRPATQSPLAAEVLRSRHGSEADTGGSPHEWQIEAAMKAYDDTHQGGEGEHRRAMRAALVVAQGSPARTLTDAHIAEAANDYVGDYGERERGIALFITAAKRARDFVPSASALREKIARALEHHVRADLPKDDFAAQLQAADSVLAVLALTPESPK